MNSKTQRKAIYIVILFSISLLVACAKYETRWVPETGGFVPVELLDADKALAEARGKGLDLLGVDVESGHGKTGFREYAGQGQADIAKPDDADFSVFGFYSREEPFFCAHMFLRSPTWR